MSSLDWQRFGDPATFAVEFMMDSDPDGGRYTDPVEAASWGAFRLWVNGRNLCEHDSPNGRQDAVHWYLLPLLEWLAGNWAPLLHEERLPVDGNADTARVAYELAMRRHLGNTDARAQACCEQWQDWWRRHALRSCRKGGIFPDVFIRRLRDSIELSWGSQRLPGMPKGVVFVATDGIAALPVSAVADPLHAMLVRAVEAFDRACAMDDGRLDRLAAAVRGIKQANASV